MKIRPPSMVIVDPRDVTRLRARQINGGARDFDRHPSSDLVIGPDAGFSDEIPPVPRPRRRLAGGLCPGTVTSHAPELPSALVTPVAGLLLAAGIAGRRNSIARAVVGRFRFLTAERH